MVPVLPETAGPKSEPETEETLDAVSISIFPVALIEIFPALPSPSVLLFMDPKSFSLIAPASNEISPLFPP